MVVFSDESCFYLIPHGSKKVRRPRGSNRFDEKYCNILENDLLTPKNAIT